MRATAGRLLKHDVQVALDMMRLRVGGLMAEGDEVSVYTCDDVSKALVLKIVFPAPASECVGGNLPPVFEDTSVSEVEGGDVAYSRVVLRVPPLQTSGARFSQGGRTMLERFAGDARAFQATGMLAAASDCEASADGVVLDPPLAPSSCLPAEVERGGSGADQDGAGSTRRAKEGMEAARRRTWGSVFDVLDDAQGSDDGRFAGKGQTKGHKNVQRERAPRTRRPRPLLAAPPRPSPMRPPVATPIDETDAAAQGLEGGSASARDTRALRVDVLLVLPAMSASARAEVHCACEVLGLWHRTIHAPDTPMGRRQRRRNESCSVIVGAGGLVAFEELVERVTGHGFVM